MILRSGLTWSATKDRRGVSYRIGAKFLLETLSLPMAILGGVLFSTAVSRVEEKNDAISWGALIAAFAAICAPFWLAWH